MSTTVSLESADWHRLEVAALGGLPLGVSDQDNRIKAALKGAQPPPPPAPLKIELTADKKGVIVVSTGLGASVDSALMEPGGGGFISGPKGLKAGAIILGSASHPVIDVHPVDATGKALTPDVWAGKVTTVQVAPPGPEPTPEPPVPHSGFSPGLVCGLEPADIAAAHLLHAKYLRVEVGYRELSRVADICSKATAAGLKINLLVGFAGDMIDSASAQALGPISHKYGNVIRSIELGNETSMGYQYNDGVGNASYHARARVYAQRVKEAGIAMSGSGVPLLAQAEDGGSGSNAWVSEMFGVVPDLAKYVGGWVCHTYGPPGVAKLERMIRFLGEHGEHSLPLDLTEDGIATDDGRALNDDYGYGLALTYAFAAEALTHHIAELKRVGGSRLRSYMLYQDRDQRPHGADNQREHYFGAVQQNGQPKGALTTMVQKLLAE